MGGVPHRGGVISGNAFPSISPLIGSSGLVPKIRSECDSADHPIPDKSGPPLHGGEFCQDHSPQADLNLPFTEVRRTGQKLGFEFLSPRLRRSRRKRELLTLGSNVAPTTRTAEPWRYSSANVVELQVPHRSRFSEHSLPAASLEVCRFFTANQTGISPKRQTPSAQ